MSIKKLMGVICLSLFFSVAVRADSPHFIDNQTHVHPDGINLEVCFKEAGLGDNQLINYEASAEAAATYACINGGGNHPKARNKETVEGPVEASDTFDSGQNGQIIQCLTLMPPSAGDFSCPNGQTLVLACVEYSNVMITDTTNGITVDFEGEFFALDPDFGQLCDL
jgi:hypothetical protein